MANYESDKESRVGRKFMRRHWRMVAVWIVAGALVAVGAVLTYLWFVGDAQVSGLVPETLGLWSMNHLFQFCWRLLFYMALVIGIPVAIVAGASYMLWYKRIPAAWRKEYKDAKVFGGDSKWSDKGGFVTFAINVLFVLKVYLDGNWNMTFSTWTFDYLVETFIWALAVFFAIAAVPIILGLIWWVNYGREDETGPETETGTEKETVFIC